MSDDEMRKLDVPSLQDEGYIFLWVTGRSVGFFIISNCSIFFVSLASGLVLWSHAFSTFHGGCARQSGLWCFWLAFLSHVRCSVAVMTVEPAVSTLMRLLGHMTLMSHLHVICTHKQWSKTANNCAIANGGAQGSTSYCVPGQHLVSFFGISGMK